ncbi:MAG: PaaI family thioesterase [Anaerolineales bacterium]|nr:PaaI family thioesterase [Anaerolineales bacterium]
MKTLQPNSRQCFVCGLENPFGLQLRFYQTGEDEVSTECSIPERYQSYPGMVHGGVIAAMLDEAAGRSLMEEEPPRFMYTARLEIHYRKNVPVSQPLRLVGKVGVSKRRTATATSAIYDQEGNLLAEAEALLVNVPEEMCQNIDLEALGWKVYPQEA